MENKYYAFILAEDLTFDCIIYDRTAIGIQEQIAKLKKKRSITVVGIFFGKEVDFTETIVVHPV